MVNLTAIAPTLVILYIYIYILVGSVYLNRCEVNRLIPIWLIVFGVLSLIQTMINVAKRCCSCKKNDDEESGQDYGRRSGSCFESLLTTFLFVWIIIGSVWVFRLFDSFKTNNCIDFSELNSDVCCHPVPYLFSFVTLIVMYTISALILCCSCCCIIFFALRSGGSSN